MSNIEKLKEIKAEIKRIEEDIIRPLKKEYDDIEKIVIENHEIKCGDLVDVENWDGKIVKCYISSVDLGYDYKFKYTFNKVKNDGTMSGQGSGVWSYKSVKKLFK